MPQQPKQPRKTKKQARKPLGESVEWSDSDLDKLSEISEADLKAADALWQNAAPKKLKKLLDADVKEES